MSDRDDLLQLVGIADLLTADVEIPQHIVVSRAQVMAGLVSTHARLIVAAPELKEACIKALGFVLLADGKGPLAELLAAVIEKTGGPR